MEDGALALEHLEDELLGDEDDHAAATTMPPPSSMLFPYAPSFPRGSTSQPPSASARGGHARPSLGRDSTHSTLVATGDDNPTPFVHIPREKKLEISRGKRKHP